MRCLTENVELWNETLRIVEKHAVSFGKASRNVLFQKGYVCLNVRNKPDFTPQQKCLFVSGISG